jgi:hypothetical protein
MDKPTAWQVLCRSVGDDLEAFFAEPRVGVSEEAIRDAGKSLLDLYRAEQGVMRLRGATDEERLQEVIRDARAEIFEAWWVGERDMFSDIIPEARAELIGFLESRMGRPLSLEGGQ